MSEALPYIVVVGSCNMDLISYVDVRPERGETILGERFEVGFGGKGANQAVAASRLGAQVYMVAKVGNDSFGRDTIENFVKNKVNKDLVFVTSTSPTGTAPITVESSGQNSIIVNAGANRELSCEDVRRCEDVIKSAKVLVCQGEIPTQTTLEALKMARKHNVITILNPAPSNPEFTEEFYRLTDIFCPNESECLSLSGIKVLDDSGDLDLTSTSRALDFLLSKGCACALVTLGPLGAVFKGTLGPLGIQGPQTLTHVRCPVGERVEVVDTTGAGDEFLGSLSYFLCCHAESLALEEVVRRSVSIASTSVQHRGTQTSFPHRADLDNTLFS